MFGPSTSNAQPWDMDKDHSSMDLQDGSTSSDVTSDVGKIVIHVRINLHSFKSGNLESMRVVTTIISCLISER